jgi:hypothetical protein
VAAASRLATEPTARLVDLAVTAAPRLATEPTARTRFVVVKTAASPLANVARAAPVRTIDVRGEATRRRRLT